MSCWQNWAVVALIVFQSMLAVVITAKPEALGLPTPALNWMAVLNVGVGVLLNQLTALGRRQPPRHPARNQALDTARVV